MARKVMREYAGPRYWPKHLPAWEEIPAGDVTALMNCCHYPWWRLNNLYQIVNERGETVRFRMRPPQAWLMKNLHKRNVILKARQLGFTTMIDVFALDLILWTDNLRAEIIGHNREDAAVIFRDKVKYPYGRLAPVLRNLMPASKQDAGELLLRHNSSVRVATSARSATLNLLHVSEYGRICRKYPERAREIKAGSLPAVHKEGFVFIESTAEGRSGHFYELCLESRAARERGKELTEKDFQFFFFPWWRHTEYVADPNKVKVSERLRLYFDDLRKRHNIVLTPQQVAWYVATESGPGGMGEDMLEQYPSTPDEPFLVSLEGTYYRREMQAAWREGRVCEVGHQEGYLVHTAWDIGRDTTAIWFFQPVGERLNMIDYYESSDVGLSHYADMLKARQKKNEYRYGRHIGPHDIAVGEWGSGRTRLEIAARDHGINFEIAPKVSVEDGIEAVRNTLHCCWFDEVKCEAGIKALESYRKEWDSVNGVWARKPLHDRYCHGADSMRYLCLSVDQGVAELKSDVDDWFKGGGK